MDVLPFAEYIEKKKVDIVDLYRPRYHMSPTVGWMNDPNGLIFFGGQYHLYYQANPYRTKPGKMVWGHFVSSDLISFRDLGIALAPSGIGENAYSGGAIEEAGEINIFYTLHDEKKAEAIRYDGDIMEGDEILTEVENEKRKTAFRILETTDTKTEEIYHSSSRDGMTFEKGDLVFDNKTLPEGISQADFRDPCPVKINDTYYIFVGGKDLSVNKGVIIVLKGKTLKHFEFAFLLGPYYELGDMAECPSYMRIDGKDVILVCGSNTVRRENDFRNINCSVAVVGDLDFEKGEMKVDFIKEIDKGDSFYAPQFIREAEKPTMVGWMEMWGKKYPTSKWHHGYVGAFTIPRILSLRDGDLLQHPLDALEKYESDYEGEGLPRCADFSFRMGEDAILVIEGDNGKLIVGNSAWGVYLNNAFANSMYECVRHTNRAYREASIRVLLDTSSIEIFVSDGREVISSRFYIDGELRISLSSGVHDLKVKKIGERL